MFFEWTRFVGVGGALSRMVDTWWGVAMRCFCVWMMGVFCVLMEMPVSAGEIRGAVADREEGGPLPGVNLHLIGTRWGAVSDTAGNYVISKVPGGTYRLEASMIGYRTAVLEDLVVHSGAVVRQDIVLQVDLLTLDEIVVTPGRFSVLKRDPAVPQTLSREEIRTMPQIGEDIYRAIVRLPGVSGSDFSARFNVRGGEYDQVLVTLDGLELYEPFHLKDIAGGAISIVDVEAIGGIDIMTGGFPADYGDRESAVLEMKSRTPRPGRRTSAGIGLMNVRFLSEGATEDVGWLFSARRGYIDLVLKMMNEEDAPSPDYYDLFGRLTFGSGSKHRFGLNMLWAADKMKLVDSDDGDTFNSSYSNGYAWLTWEVTYGSGLYVRSLPYVGRISQRRDGETFDNDGEVDEIVDDERSTTVYGLKSDWKVEAGRRHLLRFGFDVKGLKADYDYFNRDFGRVVFSPRIQVIYDTTRAVFERTGSEVGLYLADKWRIFEPLTADLGVRYDRHSYTGEGRTSPRAAVALALGSETVVRAAWGRYYQAQGIGELDVQDGVTQFRRAELATHTVVGIERRLGDGLQARVEGYHKAFRHIHDRFDNLNDDIEVVPEIVGDRIHLFPEVGTARGIEFYLKRDTGGRLSWWTAYAYAKTEETHDPVRSHPNLQGRKVPRAFDQRHTFSIDLNYRPSPAWSLSMAWQIRSGWLYTGRELVPVSRPDGSEGYRVRYTDFYGDRYSPFHRLDVKVSRRFTFQKWRLFTSLELINTYNKRNIRRYYYNFDGRTLTREAEKWFPLLPSLTVSGEF